MFIFILVNASCNDIDDVWFQNLVVKMPPSSSKDPKAYVRPTPIPTPTHQGIKIQVSALTIKQQRFLNKLAPYVRFV